MEIHSPEHPLRSFKDFAVHIAVVTLGILIALSFEGIRESIHERRLVRETRENFRVELEDNLRNADKELLATTATDKQLKVMLGTLGTTARAHPEQVAGKLEAVENPYYFFSDNAWQTALSTGALAHMSTGDVSALANAATLTRIYASVQQQTLTAQLSAVAFFSSHPHPTGAELAEGTERMVIFYTDQHAMVHVGQQLHEGLQLALAAAKR